MAESPLEGNSGGQWQIQTVRIFHSLVVTLLAVIKSLGKEHNPALAYPRCFPSFLTLQKEFISIAKLVLKCYNFAWKLVGAALLFVFYFGKDIFWLHSTENNNLVEVLGNFLSIPFLICSTFSYPIWKQKEYLTMPGDQLQMINSK